MDNFEKLAKAAANAYHREWRAKNPDKVREANRRYWLKKAEAILAQEKEVKND